MQKPFASITGISNGSSHLQSILGDLLKVLQLHYSSTSPSVHSFLLCTLTALTGVVPETVPQKISHMQIPKFRCLFP